MWVELVWLVISVIISYALGPKPPEPKPASLSDFSIPTASSGRPIPVVYGSGVVTGANVVWYGDLRTTPIKSGGGKK